jgi:hypothetical protein
MDGQHRRCLALLRSAQLLDDVRFLYLAAKCLAATGEWEECLTVLGGWDASDPEPASEEVNPAARPHTSALLDPHGQQGYSDETAAGRHA